MDEGRLKGKVAIVTGAGAGLGRSEALALAARGADLVLADIGSLDETSERARSLGVRVDTVTGDIRRWGLADELVDRAQSLGRLSIVVNNAGILRDAMIFTMPEAHWDDVVEVHLKGHAALTRAATAHWRAIGKSDGGPVYGRIVNTASEAALAGSAGQPNYAAAKAGIIALTVATSRAMAKYGVTANAICPRARTGMTAGVFEEGSPDAADPLSPEHVARFVAYLSSPEAAHITGRAFVVYGRAVGLVAEPEIERTVRAVGTQFDDDELASAFAELGAARTPVLEQLRRFEAAATGS